MLIKWMKNNPTCERSFRIQAGETIGLLFKNEIDAENFSQLWIEWIQTRKHFDIQTKDGKRTNVKVSVTEVDLQLSETLTQHLLFYGVTPAKVEELKRNFFQIPFETALRDCSLFEQACCRVLLNQLEDKIIVMSHLFDGLSETEIQKLQAFEHNFQTATCIHLFTNPLYGRYCETLYGQNISGDFLLLKRNEVINGYEK